jgi:hypothetical protein
VEFIRRDETDVSARMECILGPQVVSGLAYVAVGMPDQAQVQHMIYEALGGGCQFCHQVCE